MAADWSDLPEELVRVVADLLLATNDAYWYVAMTAVCHNWRVAIPKLHEWVMLDEKEPGDGVDGRLFLHASTGRFLRRRLPSVSEHDILVGASDGLLVLGERVGLHAARLLNPFTGRMLRFAAPIPQEDGVRTAVAGSTPTLLFAFEDKCDGQYDKVYCADATSPLCQVQFQGQEGNYFYLRSVVSYDGHLYVIHYQGEIFKIIGRAPNYHGELIAKTNNKADPFYFLVESPGELLLVVIDMFLDRQDLVEVFRVNIDRKVLEPVRNIGSRALFLGPRCLSVDADKLPSVDRSCIYYAADPYTPLRGCISRYDLNDSKIESIPWVPDLGTKIRPLSLAQMLFEYCVYHADIPSQIEKAQEY